MGTWGTQTFQDDQALDWLFDLEENSSLAFLEKSVQLDDPQKGIDEVTGTDFLAACEIVAALLHRPSDTLPEMAVNWINSHSDLQVGHLVQACTDGLTAMTSAGSGLNELWKETDDYPEWVTHIQELKRQISGK